jgi:arylsulfatase A-like enzyme
MTSNASSKQGDPGMPTAQVTLAETLKAAGYATAHIGKWHLGYSPETMPNAQGFDHSFGHMGGCIDNFSHFFYWAGPNRHDLWRNGAEVFAGGKFFPDLMVEEATRFIEANQDRPFFLYLAMNTPHYPYQGEPGWLEHYRHLPYPRNLYAAFVSTLDDRIHRVVRKLDQLGLRENTIIIFQSDNGHSTEERAHFGGGSAGPFRGTKFSLFEGGIRVPAIVSWPGRLPEGQSRDQVAHSCDWLPTIAALCGVELLEKDIDGKSLVEVLRSPQAPSPHQVLHWAQGNQWAVRAGDWKLLSNPQDTGKPGRPGADDKLFLANLRQDKTEQVNLSAKYPEQVQRLKQLHETLSQTNRPPPGAIIAHLSAKTQQYIGSPSLAVLPGGDYVASHDIFGPGSARDRTVVFGSTDQGKTWQKRAEIQGQWWSTLFAHNHALYLAGTSQENGHVVIRRSSDGGASWTTPKDKHTGLLLADGKYHCAPVPVVTHAGRLWRAMEQVLGPGGWGKQFHAFVMSAPVDADLLKAESWTFSNRLGRNPQWLGGKFGGWLEGNVVVSHQGQLVNILRVDYPDDEEKAAIVEISPDGAAATFDPQTGFIDFPGGCKKFTIRPDPRGGGYWSLSNFVPLPYRQGNPGKTRNTLALIHSTDLRNWEVRSILLQHPDPEKHGFQYLDWLFEGNDLIAVSRTAYDDGDGGAHNQHDANYLTFHRFNNFRQLAIKG